MSTISYPVFLVYSEDDQAWLASVDQLPGCAADGETPEEALANAKVAIETWIETAKELNRSVPEPLNLKKLEEAQALAFQKQQEALQTFIQRAVSDVLSQVQQVPKAQAFGGLVHHFGAGRVVGGGIPLNYEGLAKV